MTDAELRAIREDRFTRHYPTVYHVVLKMVRNATDANDITQSAFLKAVESADSWKPAGSFRNWLLAIAVNEVRQFRRSAARRNRPEHFQEIVRKGGPVPGQEGELQRREFEEHLEQALQHFPDELKEPLVLHYYQNLSYSEMAEVLGIPKSTVQFRMDQALQRLRDQLKKRGVLALFLPFLPSRPVLLGLTAMKVKIVATALVILCCLLPFSALVWRSQGGALPGAPQRTTPASSKGPARAGSEAPAPVSDGAAIFGRVLEKGTDAPIAGALIDVYNLEEGAPDRTLTDENGAFRLASTLGSRAMHQLRITAKGYAPLSAPSLPASPAPGTWHLSPGGTIIGRVEDRRGLPVFPYRIAMVRDRFDGKGYDEVRSLYQLALPENWVVEEPEASYHADGRFELRHVEPGRVTLLAVVEGAPPFRTPRAPDNEEHSVQVLEGRTTEVGIIRPDTGTLRVRVVDSETRAPLAGARVTCFSYIGRHVFELGVTPCTADANGLCALPVFLDPRDGSIDSVFARASKAGYSSKLISMSGQENAFFHEVALGRPARLRGRVQGPDGAPVEGAAVYLTQSAYGSVAARVFTNALGEYDVPDLNAPERYLVHVFERSLKNSRAVTPVHLREGEVRELHFGVQGEASLSGTVTWKGAPVRAASICVDPERRLESRVLLYTNDRGEFRVEPLAAGTYELSLNMPRGYPDFSLTRTVTVREKETIAVDFTAGAWRIRGKALISGTLPADAFETLEVVARRVGEDRETVEAALADDGAFELSVPQRGIYHLIVRDAHGHIGDSQVQVDLTTRTEVDDVRIPFRRNSRDGTIRLRLVDGTTGEPIPEGSYQYSVGHLSGAGYVDGGLIDEEAAQRGRYRYVVGGQGYVSVPVEVDLTTRSTAERTIRLQRSEAVLVSSVDPSSPAERAGLREGDVIVSYDGRPTPDAGTLEERTGSRVATQKVPLEIRRGGEPLLLFVPGGLLGIEAENTTLRR